MLHIACFNNDFEIAKLLVDAKADVNALTGENETTLRFAAKHVNLDLVKLLLNDDEEKDQIMFDWDNLINSTATRDHRTALEFVCHGDLTSFVNVKESSTSSSSARCYNKNAIKMKTELLDYLFDIQEKRGYKVKMEMINAISRHEHDHNRRLQYQSDLRNIISQHLNQYIGYKDNTIIEEFFRLLENEEETSLFYFIKNGNVEMLEKMYKLFPNYMNNKFYHTPCELTMNLLPLQVAMLYDQSKCRDWILSKYSDNTNSNSKINDSNIDKPAIWPTNENIRDKLGKYIKDSCVLSFVELCNNIENFKTRYSRKSDNNEFGSNNNINIDNTTIDTIDWDIIFNKTKPSLLGKAIENQFITLMETMLSLKADPNVFVNANGTTCLILACRATRSYSARIPETRVYYDMIKLLLENGANVNAYNTSNESPLSIVASRTHFDLIQLLLSPDNKVSALCLFVCEIIFCSGLNL